MKFLPFFLLLFVTACSAPKKITLPYADRYAADLAADETLIESSFQHTLTRSKTTGKYIRRDYFPDTKTLIEYREFSSIRPYVLDGNYREWSDDGKPRSEGRYADGERTGVWTNFHDGTQVKSTGSYRQGEKQGPWTSYHKNGNRYTQTEFTTDPTRREFIYDTLGVLRDTLEFFDGELVRGKPFGELKRVERMPTFGTCGSIEDDLERKRCSEMQLFTWLSKNLQYPPKARMLEIQGTGIVTFVVEKDGSVVDAEIIRGVSGDIRREILRIVERMPAWGPGMQDEEPVRVQYTLPVRFRLE